jgi:hypothetical protein
MENHPIPQDVTGFKFKLIGSVTVKQFLYLLGFGILATVVFMLQPLNFVFIRIPLMVLFGGIGAALAFLPIEGRPMDVMLMNFIRAIPSENRYIYRKRGVNLAKYEFFAAPAKPKAQVLPKTPAQTTKDSSSEDKRAILISRLRNSGFKPDDAEARTLNNIKTFFDDDSAKPKKARVNEAKLAEVYAGNIASASDSASASQSTGISQITTIISPKQAVPVEEPKAVEKKQADLTQKEEAEIPMTKPEAPKVQPLPKTEEPKPELKLTEEKKEQPPAITVPQTQVGWTQTNNLPAGFPSLPDVPNIVLGMVRDPRGKTLPNVLVEVVDSAGIPVRAFKTNALGQFASATPLANGSYKIYFDDPQKQHEIAPVDIELTGEIFQPVDAVSVDDREKLRRELFEGSAPSAA